jgi:membrane protein YqaA with SNARE-associated domain
MTVGKVRLHEKILQELVRPIRSGEEKINLRAWFAFFIIFLSLLAYAAISSLAFDGMGDTGDIGFQIWSLSLLTFYLSLCCTFFPLPTAWIILLFGSPDPTAMNPVPSNPWMGVFIVATLGALGTAIANLNEYHIWTFILRYKKVAKVRDLHAYKKAAEWFNAYPFLVLMVVSLIPIPVDIFRWLAISCRYSRKKYFIAYFIGRWVRYVMIAGFSNVLNLGFIDIIIIQAILVLLAAFKGLPKLKAWLMRNRHPEEGPPATETG